MGDSGSPDSSSNLLRATFFSALISTLRIWTGFDHLVLCKKGRQDATDEDRSEGAGTADADLWYFQIADHGKALTIFPPDNVPIVPLTKAVTAAVSPVST